MKLNETMLAAIFSEIHQDAARHNTPEERCAGCELLAALHRSETAKDGFAHVAKNYIMSTRPPSVETLLEVVVVAEDWQMMFKLGFLAGYRYGRREMQEEMLNPNKEDVA